MHHEGSHHATFAPGATCRAILSRRLRVSETGFPFTETLRCSQRVAVRSFTDAAGERRFYCHREGHEDAVRAEALRDDGVRRARVDYAEDYRAEAAERANETEAVWRLMDGNR